MDLKKKRERLITSILAIGVFLPVLLFPWCCPKGKEPFFIMKLICLVAIKITELLRELTDSVILTVAVFTITQVLTYIFIGWIIGRLIFRDKKTIDEEKIS